MKYFSFGKNWLHFISKLTSDSRIQSKKSIKKMIDIIKIKNGDFLDIGSGSGLFSLGAREIGFNVTSIDIDSYSVKATKKVKDSFNPNDKNWKILEASILDDNFISNISNKFDVVYSWGVLHHTGNMNKAIINSTKLVKTNGFLIISIYNDQGILSKYWSIEKFLFNKSIILKYFFILLHIPYFLIFIPFLKFVKSEKFDKRGMVIWNNYLDWLGGYPFEVAKPIKIKNILRGLGFEPIYENLVGRKLGCNEFIFKKFA